MAKMMDNTYQPDLYEKDHSSNGKDFGSQDRVILDAEDHNNLQRGLKARHMSMIAIGGAIGTGLIIGMSSRFINPNPLQTDNSSRNWCCPRCRRPRLDIYCLRCCWIFSFHHYVCSRRNVRLVTSSIKFLRICSSFR